jgi:SAM-dependent methyltransferase
MLQHSNEHKISPTFSTAIADARNYIKWIISKFSPYLGDRILEVGIGHGSYFEQLRCFGAYLGLDIDANLVSEATLRYSGADFKVADITSKNFGELVPSSSVKSVVCCNVLEHIDDDRVAITNLLNTLEVSGHLLLLVPAHGFLYNDLDRLAGHHRRYNKKMMKQLAADLPAQVIRMDYFNPIGGLAWLINKFIKHQSLDSRGVNQQIHIFDKFVLPFSKTLDPLTRLFFGQSLVGIFKKL